MANITIGLTVTGKARRSVELEQGTTLKELLEDVLQMNPNGKSIMVSGRKIHAPYETELLNKDEVAITTNNTGA